MLHVHLRCVRFSVTAARELLARGGVDPGQVALAESSIGGFGQLASDFAALGASIRGEAQSSGGGVLPFDGASDEDGDAVSPLWDLPRAKTPWKDDNPPPTRGFGKRRNRGSVLRRVGDQGKGNRRMSMVQKANEHSRAIADFGQGAPTISIRPKTSDAAAVLPGGIDFGNRPKSTGGPTSSSPVSMVGNMRAARDDDDDVVDGAAAGRFVAKRLSPVADARELECAEDAKDDYEEMVTTEISPFPGADPPPGGKNGARPGDAAKGAPGGGGLRRMDTDMQLQSMGEELGMNPIEVPEAVRGELERGAADGGRAKNGHRVDLGVVHHEAPGAHKEKQASSKEPSMATPAVVEGERRSVAMRRTVTTAAQNLTGMLPKAANRIRWGLTVKAAAAKERFGDQAEEQFEDFVEQFKKRVRKAEESLLKRGTWQQHKSAEARLQDVLEELKRDAPPEVVRAVVQEEGLKGADIKGEKLVEMVVAVEAQRTRHVLEASRVQCEELMEISGSHDFVRTIGEESSHVCGGIKLVHPNHPLIQNFDLLIMFILIFVFFSLPLTMAFESVERGLEGANFVMDLIFCVDVVKNLNVGYYDERGVVVMNRELALKNYLQTWFLIDTVSSFPIDKVMDAVGTGAGGGGGILKSKKGLKMLRLVRMTKLVKLLRASQVVKKFRDTWNSILEYYKIHVSDSTVKLLRLFFMMLTLSHWGSCLMFILLKSYDYPRESWAVKWDLVKAGSGTPTENVLHCYTWGIYKTLLLVLGSAYQEFPTAQVCEDSHGWCVIESWMTLVGVFFGCFFNAVFVSTITSILVSMDVSMQEFEEQLQRTNEYMRSLHLPTDLRDRIRDYYHHRWDEGVIFDESLILERLNPELCLEILNYKIRDLVPKVPLLRTTPKAFYTG